MYAHASAEFLFRHQLSFLFKVTKNYAIYVCVCVCVLAIDGIKIIAMLFLAGPAGKSPFLDLRYILILYLSAPFMVNNLFGSATTPVMASNRLPYVNNRKSTLNQSTNNRPIGFAVVVFSFLVTAEKCDAMNNIGIYRRGVYAFYLHATLSSETVQKQTEIK